MTAIPATRVAGMAFFVVAAHRMFLVGSPFFLYH